MSRPTSSTGSRTPGQQSGTRTTTIIKLMFYSNYDAKTKLNAILSVTSLRGAIGAQWLGHKDGQTD